MIYEAATALYEDNWILPAYSMLLEGHDYARISNLKDLLFNSHHDLLS